MSTWINFKELRSKLQFEQLLRYYEIEIKRKGEQHLGFCPLPGHRAKSDSPTFSANLDRGIFQCFGCGAKGSTLDFALLMESANLEDGRAVRKVAVKLRRELLSSVMPIRSAHPRAATALGRESRPSATKENRPTPSSAPKVIVNQPLDFELKDLDTDNLGLLEEGLTATTVSRFGLGFCSRGLLKGRVAIPLHDHKGNLVGYAGRLANSEVSNASNPEYLFPTTRERYGAVFEFRKSLFLYNGHRFEEPLGGLILVASISSVWWLWQNGKTSVVATMGEECSEAQAELLVAMTSSLGYIWVMVDGSKAGERFAHSIVAQVSPYRFVRWAKLDDGIHPTDLSAEQLKTRLTF